MKSTVKIAFSGIIAALGVVMMFLTGLIPVASIALPALAGCMLIPVVAECGVKWGIGVYAVTSILSFFLAGDREAFLIYALFFGYYPALYAVFDKISRKWLRYAAKFLVFNAAIIVDTLIVTFIFGIPFESISVLGKFTPLVLLLLANAVFVVFDFAFKGLIVTYFARLHQTARRLLKMK